MCVCVCVCCVCVCERVLCLCVGGCVYVCVCVVRVCCVCMCACVCVVCVVCVCCVYVLCVCVCVCVCVVGLSQPVTLACLIRKLQFNNFCTVCIKYLVSTPSSYHCTPPAFNIPSGIKQISVYVCVHGLACVCVSDVLACVCICACV